jgi:hypothetical protein
MIAEVAQEIFGSPSSEGGDAKTATQEARAHGSEQAHEADLAALTQVAMAPPEPVAESVAAAPMPAVRTAGPIAATVAKPDVVTTTGRDEAAQRIAKSIAEARRAQEGMLLASLQQGEPTPRTARTERTDREAGPKVDTVTKPADNPYLLPERPAATPNWSNETLAETIARYERAVAANRR